MFRFIACGASFFSLFFLVSFFIFFAFSFRGCAACKCLLSACMPAFASLYWSVSIHCIVVYLSVERMFHTSCSFTCSWRREGAHALTRYSYHTTPTYVSQRTYTFVSLFPTFIVFKLFGWNLIRRATVGPGPADEVGGAATQQQRVQRCSPARDWEVEEAAEVQCGAQHWHFWYVMRSGKAGGRVLRYASSSVVGNSNE